jgi:hypothetical protein
VHAQLGCRLPVDVVSKGQAGDWTAFHGVRRKGDDLVVERTVAVIARGPKIGTMRVAWFRGEQDKEALWHVGTFDGALDPRLIAVANLKSESTTCKLDTTFPCTRVTSSSR